VVEAVSVLPAHQVCRSWDPRSRTVIVVNHQNLVVPNFEFGIHAAVFVEVRTAILPSYMLNCCNRKIISVSSIQHSSINLKSWNGKSDYLVLYHSRTNMYIQTPPTSFARWSWIHLVSTINIEGSIVPGTPGPFREHVQLCIDGRPNIRYSIHVSWRNGCGLCGHRIQQVTLPLSFNSRLQNMTRGHLEYFTCCTQCREDIVWVWGMRVWGYEGMRVWGYEGMRV
jgi:hypothetical protein